MRDILLACMVVLLLAQGLIGALSLSALNRLVSDNTAERVGLMARQTSAQIQTGLDLGKPLPQFFGLSQLLADLQVRVPDMLGASVVLADGRVIATLAQAPTPGPLLDLLSSGPQRSATVQRREGKALQLALPLGEGGGRITGALVLQVQAGNAGDSALLLENLRVLAVTTLGAALLLVLTFRYGLPLHRVAAASKARMVAPLLVLLLAQGLYAAYTIQTFRDVWVSVSRDNTRMLGEGLRHDLNRVLGYGIEPERLAGVERPMMRLARSFPLIKELQLQDADGRVLVRADAKGLLPGLADADIASENILVFPLQAAGTGPVLARLDVMLDQDLIAAGVRERIMDAATVAVVALVAAIELLLLLTLLMDRAFAVRKQTATGETQGLDDLSGVGQVVRPVMFGFLFALALPLSFLPILARTLLPDGGNGPAAEFLMALPIAAEMGCGLMTALLAGRLTDRRGWQTPVLAGVLVSVLGNLACAGVDTLPGLVLARGLVGLGYGLAWMGLQGFIVTRSPAAYRGRNMATVIAGLFAGHLSGAAVGAMLMQQLGFAAVFYIGAALLCLPLVGVLTLMWPYRQLSAQAVSSRAGKSWTALRRLLLTRDFGLLLLGCVIPFSIAQVGLLTYALPLYLEAYGATASSVGRVLMLYGLFVIYIGPYMGRVADQSASKKHWIVAGGLIGSAGLLSLYFASGLLAAAAAVVLLALASCFAGGAQAAYMLDLKAVQDYGAAGATSVMRAADKFGQMLGPLLVGGLFASMGISGGLVVTGGIYLIATLAFLVFAPGLRQRPQAAVAPVL
ncbi:MFS transporter [Pollutimonas subterranea]|uniref:MFS transporter n=1 Tax=Pollutimonas subterranea TaxID=2045210 RepID=A0A2N4U1K6_9BURK|nr:MFS transporter [Pollutimonas subterranea]PLC48902.1 MFS transporter [Pollutimonas subterranea]